MRSLYIFFFLFVALNLSGQHTFQRTYEIADRLSIHGGMAVSHDGGFYLVNIYPDVNEAILKFHVTRHHFKGDVLWAYDYELEGYGSNFDFDIDIMETADRGVVFIATALDGQTGAVDTDLIVKFSSDGELEWSKSLGSETQGAFVIPGQSTLRQNYSDGVIVATLGSDNQDLLTNTHLASVDAEGLAEWSKIYKILDEDGIGDFSLVTAIDRQVIDTTYMIAGIADTTGTNDIFISKVDAEGLMLWSRSYTQSLAEGLNNQVLDIACANDTTTTVTGILQDATTNLLSSYVFKVDKDGFPLWSKVIQLPGTFPLTINTQVVADASNNIIIAGRFIDVSTGDLQDYMIRLNALGDLIWSKQFPRIDSYVVDPNLGLLIGGDLRLNGTEYMLSGVASNFSLGNLYPFVVRIDDLGSAVCEEDALAMLNDTILTFEADTLFWSSEDFGVLNDITVDRDTFSDYDLPMVTLLDTFFCPQDPIMVTLDATAQFAEAYEWSTGETTPMIEVTEDGEYMVTVTFDTLACFTLCDTSIITKLEFPELAINGNNSLYCETEQFILDGNPSMGLPPFTYQWSTGETTEQIFVTEFGDYSLVVTDACGNTSQETINYNSSNIPEIDPFPGLTFNQSLFCETGEYQIGIFNAAGLTDIVWSTGETGVTNITVPGPGAYSVTGIVCFQEIALSIDEGDFGGDPLTANSNLDDTAYCTSQTFQLAVAPSGGFSPYTFEWSNGETDPMITVNEIGTYEVTISDSCNDAIVEIITVDDGNIPAPVEPLLSFDVDSFCNAGALIIMLTNPQAGFTNAQWSNGTVNASQITVDEVGVYTFNALSCNQEVSATIDLSESLPTEGLQFPNVFLPGTMDNPINQTFGPHVECPNLIEDYEMKIFNRWGKMVYETDNVSGRWNGALDGDPEPSQVYFWYARYTEPGGQEITVEGDVSLVR